MKRAFAPICLLAAFLALVMAFLLTLNGCSAPPPLTPKGGYVETRLELPQKDMYYCLRPDYVFTHPDGSVDCIDVGSYVYHGYSPDGTGDWELIDTASWLGEIGRICGLENETGGPPTGEVLLNFDMDDDRNLYTVLKDGKGLFRLICVTPEGEVTDIPIPDWQTWDGDSGMYYNIKELHIDKNWIGVTFGGRHGPTVSYSGENFGTRMEFYSGDGAETLESVFTKDHVSVLKEGGELLVFDRSTGAQLQSLTASHMNRRFDMCTDSAGNLYTIDENGIDRLPSGGTVFETLMEGDFYTFGGPDVWVISPFAYCLETDSFFVGVTLQTDSALFRLTYDPEFLSGNGKETGNAPLGD